jgi:hypothetical protein
VFPTSPLRRFHGPLPARSGAVGFSGVHCGGGGLLWRLGGVPRALTEHLSRSAAVRQTVHHSLATSFSGLAAAELCHDLGREMRAEPAVLITLDRQRGDRARIKPSFSRRPILPAITPVCLSRHKPPSETEGMAAPLPIAAVASPRGSRRRRGDAPALLSERCPAGCASLMNG